MYNFPIIVDQVIWINKQLPNPVFKERFEKLYFFDLDCLKCDFHIFFSSLRQFLTEVDENTFSINNLTKNTFMNRYDQRINVPFSQEEVVDCFSLEFDIKTTEQQIWDDLFKQCNGPYFFVLLQCVIIGNKNNWAIYVDGNYGLVIFGVKESYNKSYEKFFKKNEALRSYNILDIFSEYPEFSKNLYGNI